MGGVRMRRGGAGWKASAVERGGSVRRGGAGWTGQLAHQRAVRLADRHRPRGRGRRLGHTEEGLLREPLQPAELLSVAKRSGANRHLYWCLGEPTLFGDASERPEGFAHTLPGASFYPKPERADVRTREGASSRG